MNLKLLSTEIGENWIELTYADGPELDASAPHLVLRLHRDTDHGKSVAWNRFWALGDLRDMIDELREADRKISEGRI